MKDEAIKTAKQEKDDIMRKLGHCLANNRKDGTRCLEAIK
ncbi:hypothetical protein SAMN05216552_1010158 [Pseudoduganella namucuonensis]|uniref:Uncharacterized protein n=2 Tax=Pseudoduganella namucuonensis TaxID=1035707 RepID=A0A1I7J8T4_9BURK|nr:hypothetical protein SAMN05216552_1010158 [Pseudoduganella namucuonensis]